MLLDLKTLNSALTELEQEKGISKEKVLEAIEHAFAAAYKKEYGKKGQIIRARFNPENGDLIFSQIKVVVNESMVYMPDEDIGEEEKENKTRFNPEHHILLKDARLIKSGAELDDEIEFPLEAKEDFGRIAAQTAKQVIMQKIRAAERESSIKEYGELVGKIVTGFVQRFERGSLFVDLGRAVAVLPYEEQIPGERYRQGERVQALLYKIDPEARGSFIKLSRKRDEFLVELFKQEVPELESGVIEVKSVARDPGRRAKIAVYSTDERLDPVGSLVGPRGVRVSTVTSELGGEKIDIIEWSEDVEEFLAHSISPAEVMSVEIEDKDGKKAKLQVVEDQQSLAIGRGGQNVQLAAQLTGWTIDIYTASGELVASSDGESVDVKERSPQKEEVSERQKDESEQEKSADSANDQEANPEDNEATAKSDNETEAESDTEAKNQENAAKDA